VTAVIPGDTGKIVGWNALPDTSAGINGVFTMRIYTVEKADTLKTGRTVWKPNTDSGVGADGNRPATAGQSKEYHIPPKTSQTVAIKLSPRTGVLHILLDGKRNMYYGGENGATHILEINGGRMFLFWNDDNRAIANIKTKRNVGDDGSRSVVGVGVDGNLFIKAQANRPVVAGKIELELYAQSPSADITNINRQTQTNELSIGTSFIKYFQVDTREIIRVKSDTAAHRKLFLSGSVKSADWIGQSGQFVPNVKTESDLPNESGILLVRYAPGRGKLKLCKDDGSRLALNLCLWSEAVKTDGVSVIKEASRLALSDGANWYAFELSEPTHISLYAPVPSAAIIAIDGRIRDYREFWDGLSYDIPLAPGKFTIGIKPLAERYPPNASIIIGQYPIPTLAENKPLNMYLYPGQKRFARFNMERKSKIGIGLSAQSADAEATLFDNRGNNLGKGKQIFTELNKGIYYIQLSPLSTHTGSEITLRLFGQSPPPSNPPEELIRWIINGGVGERPGAGSPPN
jgi:hypothetical protein